MQGFYNNFDNQPLKRSNNIPMQVLNWMTPIEKREQLKSDAMLMHHFRINIFSVFLVSHHLQLYSCIFIIFNKIIFIQFKILLYYIN